METKTQEKENSFSSGFGNPPKEIFLEICSHLGLKGNKKSKKKKNFMINTFFKKRLYGLQLCL